jgi:hypothetical protein
MRQTLATLVSSGASIDRPICPGLWYCRPTAQAPWELVWVSSDLKRYEVEDAPDHVYHTVNVPLWQPYLS